MIDRANDHYALDITRAKDLLDWAPQRSLRKSLPKMVDALKTDPFHWYREHGLEPTASMKKTAQLSSAKSGQQSAHSCPMHSEVIQSSPGNCPRCDARLEPMSPAEASEYTCPMHPEVVSDEPGRCPKCGMSLELRNTQEHGHA